MQRLVWVHTSKGISAKSWSQMLSKSIHGGGDGGHIRWWRLQISCLHSPKCQPICLQAVSEAEGLAILTLILEQQLAEHGPDAEPGKQHSQGSGQIEKVGFGLLACAGCAQGQALSA